MTKSGRLRILLAESPSTCHEISALLEMPLRETQIAMWMLTSIGHARKTGRFCEGDRNTRRRLYELTDRGRRMLAEQERNRREPK